MRLAEDWLAARARRPADNDAPLDSHTVAQLYGVGDYTADAHRLFVLRRVRAAEPPRDHALRWWHAWACDRGLVCTTPSTSPAKARRKSLDVSQ